jgi:hypothetical protein
MTGAGAGVRASRRVLIAAVILGSVLWSVVSMVGLLDVAMALDAFIGVPRGVRSWMIPIAGIVGVGTLILRLWWGRRAGSVQSVALFIEHLVPDLRYRLVTAMDRHYESTPLASRLDEQLAPAGWERTVAAEGAKRIIRPLAASAVVLTAMAFAPSGTSRRVFQPGAGDALDRVALARAVDPLADLVVTIAPPPYVNRASQTFENPEEVHALVGSDVRVQGVAGERSVVMVAGAQRTATVTQGARWAVRFPMPPRPELRRFEDGQRGRQLLLVPVTDSAPVVRLDAPPRDTVLPDPTGVIDLAATLADDYGLDAGWFEVIVSTGQGESFQFGTARVSERPLAGTSAQLRAGIDLVALGATHGAFLHVRAVARDLNTVSGPGIGVSETRTVRVARRGEYDSIALEALPPLAADSSLLSQRLLIMLAEELVQRRPELSETTVTRESRAIARDQERLRRRVAEIIFMRLGDAEAGEHAHVEDTPAGALSPEDLLAAAGAATAEGAGEALDFHGDETPVVAVNRPLLEAYNAMWDAGRALGVADPEGALPHMYAALEAIQRARAAERIYLRGRPAAAVIDLPRVRLSGTAPTSTPADRRPGAGGSRARLLGRYRAALTRVAMGAPDGLDSLMLLRLAALTDAPDAVVPLNEAVSALREGREPGGFLRRALAALGGVPVGSVAATPWSIMP